MKRAIVIGATSGIGKRMAEILAADGYRVGITGRRKVNLEKIHQSNPQAFVFRAFDVQDVDTSQRMIHELIEELGGLDLLVYSSGNGEMNKELDFDKEHNIIKTNVIGFTNCITFVYRYFMQHGGGQIAAITSVSGLRGNPEYAAYFSTKGYQILYLESLRIKSKKDKLNIQITELRPGFINTIDRSKVQDAPIFWMTSLEKATRQMYRSIKRKEEVAYISRRWVIIGILMKIFPRRLWDMLPF
ncbi:MAG: SDR family NAD(P)-dependent oxidoreductase [Flavobacteriales bacterium]|nr:SDR family NAD(P)-dependent oxidoreductase [Flavobacteriales bacterium]